MVCADHEVPFHTQAAAPGLAELEPTASQNVADTHETPAMEARKAEDASVGSGVAWILQAVPSHFSARLMVLPELSVVLPTASQCLAETQETALRELSTALAGVAACWAVQELPFHPSASAVCWACGVAW